MEADGTDDKIERLVRSVLQAVDARLDDVRVELHALRDATDARLAALEAALGEVQQRTATTAVADAAPRPDNSRMEQATQMLLERIEAMHQKTTIATNERLAQLGAAVDELRSGTRVPAPAEELAVVSAPLIPTPHLPAIPPPLITRQLPVVPITPTTTADVPNALPAPTPAPAPTPVPPAPTAAGAAPVEGIDLDRLSRLLEEHLGQFHLGEDVPPAR